MNVIVDYGVGNLNSLLSACKEIEMDVVVSSDIDDIKAADSIILPGVGAFGAAMKELEKRHLVEVLQERAKAGIPFLGICLGMQLLFESSNENGYYEGLGIIDGTVKNIPTTVKVPHMGWNSLSFQQQDELLKNNREGDYVYYVHSFYVETSIENIVAYSDYGIKIPGIVQRNNIIGMQFHPEKSGQSGIKLLRGYKEMILHDSISSN